MAEITNFADAARVVYGGSRGIEILLGPKIVGYNPKIVGFNPRKRQEMAEIMSFVDASRVVYRESQGIEILPRPENHVL